MRYTIKWRFILALGLAVLVAGLAVHFTHRWQVKRQVGAFLQQADLARDAAGGAEKAGDAEQARGQREREEAFLRRYLLAQADDMDARDRLARLMVRNAKTGKQLLEAYYVLEDVLRRDPSRDDLRRFTIDFAMDTRVRMFKEARGHIDALLPKRPNDGELEALLAVCLVADQKFEEAERKFAAAVAHRPDLIDAYGGLALVRRDRLKKTAEADQAVAEMLAKNPDKFRAYVTAYGYLRDFGLRDLATAAGGKPRTFTADELVAEARRLAPDELAVLLAAGDVAATRARTLRADRKTAEADREAAEARRLFARAVELNPKEPVAYLALAAFEADARQAADAVAVVRKGLDAVPDSTDLLAALLDYQFRAGDAAGADETLAKLKARGLKPDANEYYHARVLALRDDWKAAAPILERVIPKFQESPRLSREANLLLARCFEQLGENERRLAAVTTALTTPTPMPATDPLWGPAMAGKAEAQAALGRADDALRTYREMTNRNLTWVPGMLPRVARLELLRALRADGKPDWAATEAALAAAEKAAAEGLIPDPTEVRILRANLTHQQGKPAEARKLLEQLRAERPNDPAVRIELAMQDVREKNLPQALATLAAAEKDLPDSPELRLTRAQLWAAAKEPDLGVKLVGLAAGGEKFGPAAHRRLLRGLAEVATAAGADAEAGRLWDDLARAKPHDLGVQLVRFERAGRAGDVAAMEQILPRVVEIDGETGTRARMARAMLLMQKAAGNDRGPRDQALAILDGLERERVGPPLNARVAYGQAVIHDANGNPDAAREKYRQAVDLGVTNPQALRRLMELLTARGQQAEAEAVFRKLPPAVADSPEVLQLAAGLSLRRDDRKEALERAIRAVPETSTNYKDLMWLGRVHWLAGDKTRPEALFRKAAELRPDAQEPWLVLVQYLLETDRKDEAARTFEQAVPKLPKADQALFRAAGYAQLGETGKAVAAYQQARVENPNDVRAAFGEAEYLLRLGRLAEARDGFKRVLTLPTASAEDKAAATQRFALATAADPDYATARQAVELLPGGAAGGADTPAGRRSQAMILALQKDRDSRLKAIRLLEENAEGRTPAEQFMLAQVYNMVGNRLKVRAVMSDLLKAEKNHLPLYVGFWAAWLLRDGDVKEAEPWVARLAKADPDSLQTAELKARLAVAKKDTAAARAAIVPKADAPNAPVGLIARVCEDIGLYDDAEKLLRKFVDDNKAKEPALVLAVPAYLGRRGQTDKALQMLDELRGKLPAPAVGDVSVNILYNATVPVPAETSRVAGWLEQAVAKAESRDRAFLRQQLASVKNLQADYAGAAALYRQALADNPRDVLAMNNLAYLISAKDNNHAEALGLIDQAKKVIGPNPELLDTEALIRLNRGDAAGALKLLEGVVAEAPSGTGFFHLAQAEAALKHDLEARRAWRRANELGLKVADLHPLERPGYEALKAKMN